jgi:hypothetical protein
MAHSRAPITTPPNVVMGMPIGSAAAAAPNSPSVQVSLDKRDPLRNSTASPGHGITQSGTPVSNSAPLAHQTASSRSVEDPQSAAQRQAAAKLALRKQLEKTLLQVSTQVSLVSTTDN